MRPIKTMYYSGREVKHTNSSNDANKAVGQCVVYMQVNYYGAMSAEVFDNETGELHAVVRRTVSGMVTITYRRDPTKYERRLSLQAFANL